MSRPLRLEFPGALWHLTSRGNDQRTIFLDDADRLVFLSLLARAIERFRWILHAWTLMTNHFHLVLETPECTLSRGMHWLNGCYAQYFNRRYRRSGHLFQSRFNGILVDSNEYFLELVRYTVLNPVRAGMVERAEQYRWSSYRATAGLDPAPEWLTVSAILGRLAQDPGEARELYQRFVGKGLKVPSPWEKISGQMYLGGPVFLAWVQEKIDEAERSEEHPRAMREVGCPSFEKIAATVAGTFGTTAGELVKSRGGEARLAAAHLGWHTGRLRLRQIARGLRVRSRGHVTMMIRRSERASQCDPEYRARLEECQQRLRRAPPVSCLAPV